MNRIADVEAEPSKLDELQSQGLINSNEFAAKKALILAKPIVVGDSASDMRIAKKLSDAAIIDAN